MRKPPSDQPTTEPRQAAAMPPTVYCPSARVDACIEQMRQEVGR